MNRSLNLLVSVLMILVGVALLVWAVHHERQWAATLRQLQRRGVQVRAAEVQIENTRRHRGDYVTYRFLPVGRPEMLPQPHIDPTTQPDGSVNLDKSITQMKELEDWTRKAAAYHPWIWGGHRISGATRDAITMHDDRVVTYLPDAPHNNAIGKLTDQRIASEWRSNPVILIVAIYLGL